MINKLIIDSTHARTELCELGAKYPTDKSPYSSGSASGHRHAYTAVYDLLFCHLRDQFVNLGEIGIERNNSMKAWREYFPTAYLVGWEYDREKINKAVADDLMLTAYHFMDVRSIDSILEGFYAAGRDYHILIDDSTHQFEDQIRILSVAHQFVKPGGYFIIEDVFKNRDPETYEIALAPYRHHYRSAFFVETAHAEQYSGDWQNDKLLVLCRGEY